MNRKTKRYLARHREREMPTRYPLPETEEAEPIEAPAGHRTAMMYVERCADSDPMHGGPAWIGRVTYSKSGRSLYYRGLHLQRFDSGGYVGNHVDTQTGIEYWVSGVKKRGSNRHPQGGSGPIEIDDDVRAEYEALRSS